MTGSSQHGSMEEKSCLTSLIGFYDQMTGLVDDRRAGDVVYLDFHQAFNTVSHNILTDKSMKCRLDKWAAKCSEN